MAITSTAIVIAAIGALLNTELFVSVSATDDLSVLRLLHEAYPDWRPRGIVDIGANIGRWTQLVHRIFPGVKTFMIEASTSHRDALEAVKKEFDSGLVEYKIALLSHSDGQAVDFYDNHIGRATGNSMFKEQTKFFDHVKPGKRTTSKLDSVVGQMEHIDYIKLDVQGAELLVLSGGSETLKKASFVQLEINVVEYNKGGSCWHEVDEVLRQHGFAFYDSDDYMRLPDLMGSKGIGSFDALYIKPSSSFLPVWFTEKNVKFCGVERGKNADLQKQNQTAANDINNVTKLVSGHQRSYSSITMVLAAFVGGYIARFLVERNGYQQRRVMTLGLALFFCAHYADTLRFT